MAFGSKDRLIDHIHNLEKELEVEKEAEREQFRREWLTRSIQERRARGVTIHPIHYEEAALTTGGRTRVRFSYQRCSHHFQSGQVVRLFQNDDEVEGIISRAGRDDLEIVFDENPEWAEEGKNGLDLVFQETTYREMQFALKRVVEKIHDKEGFSRLVLTGDAKPSSSTNRGTEADLIDHTLNHSQRLAVEAILSTDDIAIVHGPPGTGKTSVLVEAIRIIALRKNEKILVSAPTNAAADLVAEKLIKANVRVLRLGHPARVKEEIHGVTLDGRIESSADSKLVRKFRSEAEEVLRRAKKYKRSFGTAERQKRTQAYQEFRALKEAIRNIEDGLVGRILNDCPVIITTLAGASSFLLKNQTFTYTIIDEATQALEPAAWIPLLKAPRLVLAGDHNQLPPVVLSESKLLRETLFERSIRFHYENRTARVHFLEKQYRMENEIMGFSNSEFYENKLITDESVALRTQNDFHPFKKRIAFIDTSGFDCDETQDENSESIKNPCESEILLKLYERVHPLMVEHNWNAGLIATYRAQADLLQDELYQKYGQTEIVEADTVDSFQGGERDWIGISLVRCNDEGEIGFLSDLRRMNVALTRAKRMLLVVGNASTISSNPFYVRFLAYVEENGDYRSIYDPELNLT